jgi:hypothetical protein
MDVERPESGVAHEWKLSSYLFACSLGIRLKLGAKHAYLALGAEETLSAGNRRRFRLIGKFIRIAGLFADANRGKLSMLGVCLKFFVYESKCL